MPYLAASEVSLARQELCNCKPMLKLNASLASHREDIAKMIHDVLYRLRLASLALCIVHYLLASCITCSAGLRICLMHRASCIVHHRRCWFAEQTLALAYLATLTSHSLPRYAYLATRGMVWCGMASRCWFAEQTRASPAVMQALARQAGDARVCSANQHRR